MRDCNISTNFALGDGKLKDVRQGSRAATNKSTARSKARGGVHTKAEMMSGDMVSLKSSSNKHTAGPAPGNGRQPEQGDGAEGSPLDIVPQRAPQDHVPEAGDQ